MCLSGYLNCKYLGKHIEVLKLFIFTDLISSIGSNLKLLLFLNFQHLREFKEILDAVHGSEKEKKLAAQFIAKFFKSFPDLMETALDRQLDLCEDEDVQVSEERTLVRVVTQLSHFRSVVSPSKSCRPSARIQRKTRRRSLTFWLNCSTHRTPLKSHKSTCRCKHYQR